MTRRFLRTAVAFAIFAVVAWQFSAWAIGGGAVGAAAQGLDLRLTMPAVLRAPPDAAELSASLARPLFSPDRRPAPLPVAADSGAAAAPMEPPAATRLIAVAIGPDRRAAILQLAAGGTAVLLQGQQAGGWQLATIAPDHVVLRAGAREVPLYLPAGQQRGRLPQ